MFNKTQPLMRSQFILVYGPGSIIESENGPRLIPSLRIGLSKFNEIVTKYKIHDVRMEHLIKSINPNIEQSINFFALPSNAAENQSENWGLYKTLIFPAWKICYNSKEHDSNKAILYNSAYDGGKCPCCGKESQSHVRFVLACPEGHLDDVNWNYAVHSEADCGHYRYFEWDAKGSSLESITVRCPNCGQSINMNDIYGKDFPCTHRLPEKELFRSDKKKVDYPRFSTIDEREVCNYKIMKVVQRQSTSLRIPLTRTLLTLPKYDSDLLKIIQAQDETKRQIIKIIYNDFSEGQSIEDSLKPYEMILGNDVISIIKQNPDLFFEEAIRLYDGVTNYDNLVDEEFKVLKYSELKDNTENFIKGAPLSHPIEINGVNIEFTVFPIYKIRTVTTQYAYQRKPPVKSSGDEENVFKDQFIGAKSPKPGDETWWYPAFEGIGEGIFITSNMNPIDELDFDSSLDDWDNLVIKEDLSILPEGVSKPLFVWWHSLSHAIIRELGYTSGYSSASIRERIYATKDGEGGILLYNTSAGDDCGMGGLVGSVENFDEIIIKGLKNIQNCSNDPLCHNIQVNDNMINGSACINCLFLSETSCECGNKFLDRHMLLGD